MTSLEETNKDLEWDLFDLWNGKEEHYQDNGQRWSPWNTLLQKISRYTFRYENISISATQSLSGWCCGFLFDTGPVITEIVNKFQLK